MQHFCYMACDPMRKSISDDEIDAGASPSRATSAMIMP